METSGRRPRKPGHSPNGKFVRTQDTAERDAQACRLRTEGLSFDEIAERLGFDHRSSASKAVARALHDIVAEPAAHLRTIEVARLDLLLRTAWDVMRARHVAVNNGRVVMDPDDPSKPLIDHGPVLAAIDRVLRIAERRAKLLGLDAPVRVEAISVDQIESEIAKLALELGMNDTNRADR